MPTPLIPFTSVLLAPGRAAVHLERCGGRTLLHAAAALGDALVSQLLLSLAPGLATAADEGGRTPLFEAACRGSAVAVRVLLEAAPEAATEAGWQGCLPLHVAV